MNEVEPSHNTFMNVLVRESVRMYSLSCLCDQCMFEQEGIWVVGDLFDVGRSLPSLHCPQKVISVQASTAVSRLESGFSLLCKSFIMA